MGARKLVNRSVLSVLAISCMLTGALSCQQTSEVSRRRLIEHQALIDFSGLKPTATIEAVKVHGGVPRQWDALEVQSNALYTHQQWRSPSSKTGIGVAHVRLPFPMSIGMLKWFAKQQYTKKANDGRIIDEWTDALGRPWFEAENSRYHVRGYVVCRGFEAWVIYFGHKCHFPPDPAELSLAARAVDTIVPDIGPSRAAPARSSDPAYGTVTLRK